MNSKRYSKEFKVRVALDTIKGQKTAAELDSEFEGHVIVGNLEKSCFSAWRIRNGD